MGQAAGQYAPQMGAAIGESVNTALGWRQVDRAADSQYASQQQANQLYRDLYSDVEGDYRPYQDAGTSALDALLRTYGLAKGQNGKADFSGFENSPDYLWAQEQGNLGANRLANARGQVFSGAQAKALSRYNQGLATQHLGSYRNGLGILSNQGLGATNALSNYRAGYGNQLGTGLTNIGDIQAAEHMGIYAVNSRHNSNMQNIHGVGGGGGGQSSYGGGNFLSGMSGQAPQSGGWGENGYNWGSVGDNFNWGG